jgi:hypothetical protein
VAGALVIVYYFYANATVACNKVGNGIHGGKTTNCGSSSTSLVAHCTWVLCEGTEQGEEYEPAV